MEVEVDSIDPQVTGRRFGSFTIAEWCKHRRVSISMYYKLRAQGKAPATLPVGRHQTNTAEADARARERQAEANTKNRPEILHPTSPSYRMAEARHASLSPDQYEPNKETLMTASARIPGRSGAICRVATAAKQAKNAAPNSSADPAPVERRSSKQRSRMTNGTALLPDIDGRSAIARRFKDITSGILADQGGADQCSESRLQSVRRFAAAAVLAEQLESRLARLMLTKQRMKAMFSSNNFF